MENQQQITQEQYVIEKLGVENARLKIALEQANFKLLLLQQELDNLKKESTENKGE